MYAEIPRIYTQGSATIIFYSSSADPELLELLADDYVFELCLRKLSLTEQLRVLNFKHNRTKSLVLQLFSRFVLNYCLFLLGEQDVFDPFKQLPMEYNEFGKPTLATTMGSKIQFNSSSSNDLISIVVQFNDPTPVGIDLSHESQDSISPTQFVDQFKGIFAGEELRQLEAVQNLTERYALFNHFWTLKESFTKFLGCGLNVDLSSFWFSVGPKDSALSTPNVSTTSVVNRVELSWQRNIQVHFDQLDPNLKSLISGPVQCLSAVLRNSHPLPVFVSIVAQAQNLDPSCFQINMAPVVELIIQE